MRHGTTSPAAPDLEVGPFAVCKHRGIPLITVINKWDRPGLDALALMDEITERTCLTPTPWTTAVEATVIDTAYPGDVVGLVNGSDLRGDQAPVLAAVGPMHLLGAPQRNHTGVVLEAPTAS